MCQRNCAPTSSKKKSKAKAVRKAAKVEPARQAEEAETTNIQAPPRSPLTADDVLRGIGARRPCSHGFRHDLLPYMRVCGPFIHVFTETYRKFMSIDTEGNLINALNAAQHATQAPIFVPVWKDLSKLEWMTSFFVTEGTKQLLQGNETMARHSAVMANHFEQSMAIANGDQLEILSTKMVELLNGDVKTLVKYYRQRIPCGCLDDKHEEVKSVTRLGFCCNAACPIPGRVVERKKMLCCTQCCVANYCSRECQVAHWPNHKDSCLNYTKQKAKLSSRKKTWPGTAAA